MAPGQVDRGDMDYASRLSSGRTTVGGFSEAGVVSQGRLVWDWYVLLRPGTTRYAPARPGTAGHCGSHGLDVSVVADTADLTPMVVIGVSVCRSPTLGSPGLDRWPPIGQR